jgi:hypothetical protein
MLTISTFSNRSTFPDIKETIHWDTVVINVIVTIISGSFAALLFNSKRYEIYGK